MNVDLMNWNGPSAEERGLAAVSRPPEFSVHQPVEKVGQLGYKVGLVREGLFLDHRHDACGGRICEFDGQQQGCRPMSKSNANTRQCRKRLPSRGCGDHELVSRAPARAKSLRSPLHLQPDAVPEAWILLVHITREQDYSF